MVSAVIAAFNEARTVRGAIAPLVGHPAVGEIIVVDDGSTDGTADAAKELGVTVIRLPENLGKAAAMGAGVRAARYPLIFFLDGDISGLTPEAIDAVVAPVAAGRCEMFVAMRARRLYLLNALIPFFPILGGERVLTRELWDAVPDAYKKRYQIEIALNYFAKRRRGMEFALVQGLTHVIKEKKRGVLRGFVERVRMTADILAAAVRLYGWETFRARFRTPG